MKHKGFTLAEVLITLGIIGVVAALTIPTLIANTNSQKFRAQFKKTISTMNQAARMAIAQYDVDFAAVKATCSESPQTDTLTSGSPTICGVMNSTLAGATYIDNLFNDYSIDNNEEDEIWLEGDIWYTYQLADGSIFGILAEDKYCTKDDPCFGMIDVNGKSLPNKQVHGEEVTAYNGSFTPAAFGICPEMACNKGQYVDQKTCKCTGGTSGGATPVITPGIGELKPSKPVCEYKVKCDPGYVQSGCKCVAKEPDPSPDPTYNVPGDANHLTDVYPVQIYDHTVEPASRAGWYVLSTTKSASSSKSSLANSQNNNQNEAAGTINSIKDKIFEVKADFLKMMK